MRHIDQSPNAAGDEHKPSEKKPHNSTRTLQVGPFVTYDKRKHALSSSNLDENCNIRGQNFIRIGLCTFVEPVIGRVSMTRHDRCRKGRVPAWRFTMHCNCKCIRAAHTCKCPGIKSGRSMCWARIFLASSIRRGGIVKLTESAHCNSSSEVTKYLTRLLGTIKWCKRS